MTKFIRVTMPDGSKYDIPARIVADDRALYYSAKDPQATYEGEFEYAMGSDDELLDWAPNNMNWEDVKRYAVKVDTKIGTDFQEGWLNGEKEIVDK